MVPQWNLFRFNIFVPPWWHQDTRLKMTTKSRSREIEIGIKPQNSTNKNFYLVEWNSKSFAHMLLYPSYEILYIIFSISFWLLEVIFLSLSVKYFQFYIVIIPLWRLFSVWTRSVRTLFLFHFPWTKAQWVEMGGNK